jgi:hypothetical protein
MTKSLFGAQDVFEVVKNGYEELAANPKRQRRMTARLYSTFNSMLTLRTLKEFQRQQNPKKHGISWLSTMMEVIK